VEQEVVQVEDHGRAPAKEVVEAQGPQHQGMVMPLEAGDQGLAGWRVAIDMGVMGDVHLIVPVEQPKTGHPDIQQQAKYQDGGQCGPAEAGGEQGVLRQRHGIQAIQQDVKLA